MSIPSKVHFCWIGPRLPWAYTFAVLSAAEHGEVAEIILHHTDALADGPERQALERTPGVRLHRIDPDAFLTDVGGELGMGGGLATLYHRVERPATKADLLRAAILYREGGVYLDLDTVTVASLRPLLAARLFIGCEFIVWPKAVRSSRSPVVWARHLSLDLIRNALRRLPDGWRVFQRIEDWYFRGVNNAVMGAEPGSAFFATYLRAMLAVPLDQLADAYALGPDLLQDIAAGYTGDDLSILDPQVFYPLPPEISEHWFRAGRRVDVERVLSPRTRVVHWYASVRTKSRVALIDPAYIRANRDHQLYSALISARLRALPEAD